MAQKRIIIKASLENINEIRRFAITSVNFSQMCETIKQIFSLNTPFSINYKDIEGDVVLISNDLELKEALSISTPLRIFIKHTDKINSTVTSNPASDEKQKTVLVPDNAICDTVSIKVEDFHSTKLKQLKEKVFVARDNVNTAKKEFIEAREELFAAKKKFRDHMRNARYKEHDNDSSKTRKYFHSTKTLARFVTHVTFPENSELPPCHEFIKTWRFRNEADHPWPTNTKLFFIGKNEADRLTEQSSYDVGTLAPGQEKDVSITMKTPTLPGRCLSFWRLFDVDTKTKFGPRVCAKVNVVDSASSSGSSSSEEEQSKVFAESLKLLNAMGFTNQKKNLRILKRCKGDLTTTVKQLREPEHSKH